MKHFAWRACNEALPTMVNLFRCLIADTDKCTICNAQPKDILHAVWGCEALENVWSQLSWDCSSIAIPPGDFSNMFAHFLQVSDDLKAEVFIIISWLLWNRRNCIRLGLQSIPLNQIVQKAGGLLQDFLNA